MAMPCGQFRTTEEASGLSDLDKAPRNGTARDRAHVRGLELDSPPAECAEAPGQADPYGTQLERSRQNSSL